MPAILLSLRKESLKEVANQWTEEMSGASLILPLDLSQAEQLPDKVQQPFNGPEPST